MSLNNHDMEERLVPFPHIIKSIRNRPWNLWGAVGELVDNSLGHGKATEVNIFILNSVGVLVTDNGIGVDDVNRIFRLGDASAHDDWAEIGQFGVGSTDAGIFLGDELKVTTVRDHRRHEMTVNWKTVEKEKKWPLRYKGKGRVAKKGEIGTQVIVTKPAQKIYHLVSSERLAVELGTMFAPGLHDGAKITVLHELKGGERQAIPVVPFTPADLTNVILISGEVVGDNGEVLRWSGRAGLSASLTQRHNGVHIGFRHRVIEPTIEPFKGASAPTLYAEVMLDDTGPWKHALSDHKDKVVGHRAALMDSIHSQIAELLEESATEAKTLALANMVAPIETTLQKALKGAGVLYHDPEEEPTDGGIGGGGGGGGGDGGAGGKKLHTPTDEGEEAKPHTPKPTGVKVEFLTREQLEGKLWHWVVSGKNMVVSLDKDWFNVLGWPPKDADRRLIELVAGILSHALEFEYHINNSAALEQILTRKLRTQMDGWFNDNGKIAPYLNRAILEAVR